MEMFEHIHNWAELLERVGTWLEEEGRFFMHIFCHKNLAYNFETKGDNNWLGRYFFTGGIMPSHELAYLFQDHLILEDTWAMTGTHYQQTADNWLANMGTNREKLLKVLAETYGSEAEIWFQRWRMFFMATSEVWGFRGGNEWLLSHFRMRKR